MTVKKTPEAKLVQGASLFYTAFLHLWGRVIGWCSWCF